MGYHRFTVTVLELDKLNLDDFFFSVKHQRIRLAEFRARFHVTVYKMLINI